MFLELTGEPPASQGLPPLQSTDNTATLVVAAFQQAFEGDTELQRVRDFDQLPAAEDGMTLLYLFGHAWLEDDEFRTAVLDKGDTLHLSAHALLDRLIQRYPKPVLLILDTCHAGALIPELSSRHPVGWTVLLASSAAESAIEFAIDGTRLALTLGRALSTWKREGSVDMVEIAVEVKRALLSPGLTQPQTVGWWVGGDSIKLDLHGQSNKVGGNRTHVIYRWGLLTSGVLVAVCAAFAGWYYWSHFLLEIELGDALGLLKDRNVTVSLQRPEVNGEEVVVQHRLDGGQTLRLRLPEDDLVVKVSGQFDDGQARSLHLHLMRTPQWRLSDKQVVWRLPSASSIKSHPGMAYIPPGAWLSGPDLKPVFNRSGFWIDLYPPMVRDYFPLVRRQYADGQIQVHDSVLLWENQNMLAAEAVGLQQLPGLLGDLNRIAAIMQAEERAQRKPAEESTPTLPWASVPCPDCPAPMTRDEAERYCRGRGMSVPTAAEWEFAGRGADGRLYPWGNKWDRERGNAGLPFNVAKPTSLKAVSSYPKGQSPFGVFDMVGNAGDWVDSEGGYARTHMGGTYMYSEEETYVFKMLPDTGEVLPRMPVTVRCVSRD